MAHGPATQIFSRSGALATLVIAIISGFIPTLQGTLLPQLVAEGRLTLAALGQVAMAEAMGTLVSIALATAFLPPKRLRLITAVAAAIGLGLDLLTAHLQGGEIVAARFGHGLCAGLLMWLWVGFLTRSANPARWIAAYVTCQAATVMLLSYWFTSALLPWGGALAGFIVVAVLYGVLLLLSVLVPQEFAPLMKDGGSIIPGLKGWIGLFVAFCQVAAILALWVYIKPIGQSMGLSDDAVGFAVTLALGSQILAGLCASTVAGRASPSALLVGVSVLSVLAVVVLALAGADRIAFTLAIVAFGFLWIFSTPFLMPYLIDVDPTRRAAVHMSTAALVGVAVGPAMASFAVSQSGVTGALWVAGLLYGLTALVILLNRPVNALVAEAA